MDTVERENSEYDLELSPLRYRQPVENVALIEGRRDVVILASANC